MPEFVIPDPNKVLLIDISKWQDNIDTVYTPDFSIMKSKGVKGVIMKCGQRNFIDRSFLVNWKNAKLAGMPRGAYWYYDNAASPESQAIKFASSVSDLHTAELGLWLDLEDKVDGQYKGWKNWYNFLVKLKELCPNNIIGIYTGHYYWKERTLGSGIPKASLDWFKQFPLWIASYTQSPLPTEPWGNDDLIWQFTDFLDGKGYGVESNELDGNYFNGSLEEFYSYFLIPPESPISDIPEIGEIPNMTQAMYNCVARFDAKVRPTPDTLNTSTSKILKGESFQVSEIVPDRLDPNNPGKVWGKIFGGNFHGMYTALEYPNNSNPISTYTVIQNVTPPTEAIVTGKQIGRAHV